MANMLLFLKNRHDPTKDTTKTPDQRAEMPDSELSEYWICCELGDGITSRSDLPCGKKNSLQESTCKRCGNWVCDSCHFVRKSTPKPIPKPNKQTKQEIRRKPVGKGAFTVRGRLPVIVEERPRAKSKEVGGIENKVYASKFHEEL
ncbi:uncharacterized protein PAC_19624 [Phialocephala subalpina]|uniref:Uncharacterized protein n=1 Tax=Phialocephala subalpina TaxID=576137 RepID=A0A1L7XXF1_9HELO|nr:uncharacterized protein PAC_19624 [Phialocephala subalpina]